MYSGAPNPHVFLTYSHKDAWKMRAVYNELRLAGFHVWIDDQLTPGTPDWKRAIAENIEISACLVCLCSPDAYKSKWVNIEIELAEERHLPMYPILVSGSTRQSVPVPLKTHQFTDCRREFNAIEALVRELINTHSEALSSDMRSVFSKGGIQWTRFGSLFWFASEVRKARLLLSPEAASKQRILDSLAQLLHHGGRLNVDVFTLRDIEDVRSVVDSVNVARLSRARRSELENKLRLVQDKVAGLAQGVDPSFTDGPRRGKPITFAKDA